LLIESLNAFRTECFFYFCIMQQIFEFDKSSLECIKKSLITYTRKFDLALILDSNSHYFPARDHLYNKYDLIAGFTNKSNPSELITGFDELHKIDQSLNHWYLGYLTYDLKNQMEYLSSNNPDYHNWPQLLFFKPSILICIRNNTIEVHSDNKQTAPQSVLDELYSTEEQFHAVKNFNLKPRITKEDYLFRTKNIMDHIRRGDIYELNFCQEFYDYIKIDPYSTYFSINTNSPAPFSAFLKFGHHYLLSASPERFLKKDNSKIISQPIKGTAPRSPDKTKDDIHRRNLLTSPKERAENIMITDLVRNDLSKIACKNSVVVDELCGIYSFPQVYQIISTIRAKLKPVTFAEIIKATFPMGSMTGAPKIRAMELIEKYETIRRGIYSGAVGYLAPGMDFDFNVVIRSLQYNAQTPYLSYMAGSAFTALSDTEKEYEECLLKSYAVNPAQNPVQYA